MKRELSDSALFFVIFECEGKKIIVNYIILTNQRFKRYLLKVEFLVINVKMC